MAYDLQQCAILTWIDSSEPVQLSFKLRNSKLNARIQRGEEGPDPPRTQKYRVS